MNIAVLSSIVSTYVNERFQHAALARGHEAIPLLTTDCAICFNHERASIQLSGSPIEGIDVLVPRIASFAGPFSLTLLRELERTDLPILNPSAGIAVAHDKLRTMQELAAHGVPVPPTIAVGSPRELRGAIEQLGEGPLIVKLLSGTQGLGVMLAESLDAACAIVEAMQFVHQPVLVQRFIEESRGRDVRAFVVGDKVVAAMRRTAAGGEFRSNLHRGGKAEGITLEPSYERVALAAAQTLGLRMAGVDLLEGRDGPLVVEVNASPGLEGIEAATKVDIAGAIIDATLEMTMLKVRVA